MASPDFSLQWGQFGAAIAAVGSLGVAAFGIVDSIGKAFAFTISRPEKRFFFHWGLPYVGLGVVKRSIRPFHAALLCAYGDEYAEIIAQQYRSDRIDGSAPDTIRQGVRLGLPFMGIHAAEKLIACVWHMDPVHSLALATALQASTTPPQIPPDPCPPAPCPPGSVDPTLALAGRFSAALDARINAAFELAEERHETVAKTLSGAVAVAMSVGFNIALAYPFRWAVALAIGLVAVPLAPVAKDLSTSMQNALTSFKSIAGR